LNRPGGNRFGGGFGPWTPYQWSLSGFFVGGVKNPLKRGSNEEKLKTIEQYAVDPNPECIDFVADHISILPTPPHRAY
jgi:hypothetical protein